MADAVAVRTVTVHSDREVDALVAEHVYGLRHLTGRHVPAFYRHRDQPDDKQEVWAPPAGPRGNAHFCGPCGTLPEFTTDPVACAKLKRKLREEGWAIELFIPSNQDRDDAWYCSVERMTRDGEVGGNGTGTEERALALAALRAYGIEVEHVREATP